MTSLFTHIVCLSCGHEMPPLPMTAKCDACGGTWLDANYDTRQLNWPAALAKRPPSLWRNEELLHLQDISRRISMGERWTPLYRANALVDALGHPKLFINDERKSTTGS